MTHKHYLCTLNFIPNVQLVNLYNTCRPAIFLVKNIRSVIFGEQELLTNFSSVFIILAPNHATIDRLNKVHNKKIEGQDFAIKFEIWVYILFCFFIKFSMLLHIVHRRFQSVWIIFVHHRQTLNSKHVIYAYILIIETSKGLSWHLAMWNSIWDQTYTHIYFEAKIVDCRSHQRLVGF